MSGKSTNILIRVSEADRAAMKQVAAEYGMSMSEFVRRMTEYVIQTRPMLIISPKGGDDGTV